MTLKKLLLSSTLCCFGFFAYCTSNAAAATVNLCDTGYITKIQVGGNGDANDGNAITVTLVDSSGVVKTYNAHDHRNADDPQGKAMLSLLSTAFALQKNVNISALNCPDFTSVTMLF